MKSCGRKMMPAEEEAVQRDQILIRIAAVEEAISDHLKALGPGERADGMRDRVELILRVLSRDDEGMRVRRLCSCAKVGDEPCIALSALALQLCSVE